MKVWGLATLLGYAVCVGLYFLHQNMEVTVWNKPILFGMEKVMLTILGISIMTGLTIFVEIVSNIPIYTKLAEVPIAFAIYLSTLLYVLGWIWSGS
jgi:hypothetical protein